ncbi:TraR/DksA family transcriptional regulator [Ichthyobacterium seriolicida]|uniref:Molecular chaperone DnaK n=1 Tax=Ichthyobacterium seriolicida TaxID=242600 RepID=A0A1J1DYK3_9FLAO|nr:TraR/DksA C4-type zinc finger protein [Ichthyobacterium seriolicida]BAV94961.1 molecular chaperone DnaK [Ichthyobacterium seriolicida]
MSLSKNNRYSDKELEEFYQIIVDKREKALKDIAVIESILSNKEGNGTEDTSPCFKSFDETSKTMSKESNMQLVIRQKRFVRDLDNAIIRIKNKTYGICRETGDLIKKERLKIVPHTTLSIDAKKNKE